MSFYHNKSSPMHSSHIITKHSQPETLDHEQERSKLSQLYTKASSQFGSYDTQEYANLVENYQNRLKTMQIGFQRSKQQFESTLKQMYKQKIILLNIISHNQELVDEFRRKLKMNPQVNFKEVEAKYNILSSGLFHSQLCSTCILKISKAQTNSNKGLEGASSNKNHQQYSLKNSQGSIIKKVNKTMIYSKQYNWMYAPNQEFIAIIAKLKLQIMKLKNNLQEATKQNLFRMSQKNKEIEHLKAQISKLNMNSHRIMHTSQPKESVCLQNVQKCQKNCELLKQSQNRYEQTKVTKTIYEQTIKQLNERITIIELQKLNSKYRARFL